MGSVGAHVIYLEPIVNSSLWLNENVERMLQRCAGAGPNTQSWRRVPTYVAAWMAAGVSKREVGGGSHGGGNNKNA